MAWETGSANMLAVYVTFGTFPQRVLFPVESKFRSAENLRNTVIKGELEFPLLEAFLVTLH